MTKAQEVLTNRELREQDSDTMFGYITTTAGLSEVTMTKVPLDDYKEANCRVFKVMGFKILHGRLQDNRVVTFMRAGDLRKKDLEFMKKLGVVEAVTHGCFAPSLFKVPGTEDLVEVETREVPLGKETLNYMDTWIRAIWG